MSTSRRRRPAGRAAKPGSRVQSRRARPRSGSSGSGGETRIGGAAGGRGGRGGGDGDDDSDDDDDDDDEYDDDDGSQRWSTVLAVAAVLGACLIATAFSLHRVLPGASNTLLSSLTGYVVAVVGGGGATSGGSGGGGPPAYAGIPHDDLAHLPPSMRGFEYDPTLVGSSPRVGRFHAGMQFNHRLRDAARANEPAVAPAALAAALAADAAAEAAVEASPESGDSSVSEGGDGDGESDDAWAAPDLRTSRLAKMLLGSPRSRGGGRGGAGTGVRPSHGDGGSGGGDDGGGDSDSDSARMLPVPEPAYEAHGARCTIERRDDMTAALFKAEYEFHKPVIFPASAFRAAGETEAINAQWTRAALLRNHCQYNVKVATAQQFSAAKGSKSVPLCDFVRRMHAGDPDQLVFVQGVGRRPAPDDDEGWAEAPLGALLRGYSAPPFLDYGVRHGLTVGGSGAGTPFHFHGDGWNEVLHGLKRWFLFDIRRRQPLPPAVAMRPSASATAAAPTTGGGASAQTVPDYDPKQTPLSWLHSAYDSMAPHVADGLFECVQGPNEFMYVPEGFLHSTLNIGDTVAIAGQDLASNDSVTARTVRLDKLQTALGPARTDGQRMDIVRGRLDVVRAAPGSDKLRMRLVESLLYAKLIMDALDQALFTVTELNQLYAPMYTVLFKNPALCKPLLGSAFYNSPSQQIAARARACREAQLFAVSRGFLDGSHVATDRGRRSSSVARGGADQSTKKTRKSRAAP